MNPAVKKHKTCGKLHPSWPGNSIFDTHFSECGKYRYELYCLALEGHYHRSPRQRPGKQ
jgi:hypothetical protein